MSPHKRLTKMLYPNFFYLAGYREFRRKDVETLVDYVQGGFLWKHKLRTEKDNYKCKFLLAHTENNMSIRYLFPTNSYDQKIIHQKIVFIFYTVNCIMTGTSYLLQSHFTSLLHIYNKFFFNLFSGSCIVCFLSLRRRAKDWRWGVPSSPRWRSPCWCTRPPPLREHTN